MRILMLNHEYPPLGGGAANATRYLLEELADRRGIEVDLVTASPEAKHEFSPAPSVTVHALDVSKDAVHYWTQLEMLRWSVKAYRKARSLMRTVDYDVVHAWFGVPAGVVARALDLPYVVSLRGSDVPGYNDRFAWQYVVLGPLIRRIWSDADAVVANSEGLRALALETADLPIDVIPNGVAVDEFDATAGEQNTGSTTVAVDSRGAISDGDRLEVLCVSRLIERKGIEYLLRAIPAVDANLTIVGSGTRRDDLEALSRRLGIDDRVTFEGYVPHEEIHQFYEAAEVFVLPSFNEGMSNTVLEAMAAGLPVVVTDTGGTAELVDDNGIVVPAGDVERIEAALETYADDAALCERHGRRSRTRAERMDWSHVADRYLETYTAVYRADRPSDPVSTTQP